MKIGVISDTHDHLEHTAQAVALFQREQAAAILHAGDIVAPPLLKPFTGIKTIAVLGNNDGDTYRLLNSAQEAGVDVRGEYAECEFDGVRFAMYHGTNEAITDALVYSQAYDVVVTGHTHEPIIRQKDITTHINPGTAHGFRGRATVAMYDTKTRTATLIDIV